MPGAWPWWPCPGRLHGSALLGTSVPRGDATMQGASVVGTAYCILACLVPNPYLSPLPDHACWPAAIAGLPTVAFGL